MATHNETGKMGEDLAVKWLREQGFLVLDRNWRHQRSEIDIVATKNQMLHIVEVKTRRNLKFGFPEEKVTKKKIQLMMKAGAHYLAFHRQWRRIQYNILSINLNHGSEPSIFWIEDVYWSGL